MSVHHEPSYFFFSFQKLKFTKWNSKHCIIEPVSTTSSNPPLKPNRSTEVEPER